MAALRLTRKNFIEANIKVVDATGRADRRKIVDYDAFKAVARRAWINPLNYHVHTTVTYGDMSKRIDVNSLEDCVAMWGVDYDDGRGTEWEERDWAEGCRDQASRSDRWMSNYGVSKAHEAAGRPKSWLWAAWDGSTLIAEDGQVLAASSR